MMMNARPVEQKQTIPPAILSTPARASTARADPSRAGSIHLGSRASTASREMERERLFALLLPAFHHAASFAYLMRARPITLSLPLFPALSRSFSVFFISFAASSPARGPFFPVRYLKMDGYRVCCSGRIDGEGARALQTAE